MELIDKSAVVAEIESLFDKSRYHEEYDCAYRDGNNGALYALKSKLNTIEVKEVDLEKEIKDYLCKQPIVARSHGTDLRLVPTPEEIAKHFFELGLNTRNEA